MTEPRIQYTKTSDGVSIAYAIIGEGIPLVCIPSAYGLGLHLYTELAISRAAIDGLVDHGFQVIRYDNRGVGSSDRDVVDFSVETSVLDLEAVLDRLGHERVAVLGQLNGTAAAVTYAVRHPDRISHLVLRDPRASFADIQAMYPGWSVVAGMRPLAVDNWELVSLNVAVLGFGFANLDLAGNLASVLRSGMTPETFMALDAAVDSADVTSILTSIDVPTLVLLDHATPGRTPASAAPVKRIAAAIPGAQLVTADDWSAAVADFVFDRKEPRPPVRSTPHGALQTILFTDVEGSTALTDRLGDAAAREVMREHERITREALKAHGGSEVKTMGDGFMASFGSATKALECAVAIQKAFDVPEPTVGARHASPLRPEDDIRVRIGLNAGEPIAEDDDLFGTAVIVAARIAAQAQGGEILVSDVVRQLVAGKGFLFNDRGEHALKGFEAPVRVWEVRWSE